MRTKLLVATENEGSDTRRLTPTEIGQLLGRCSVAQLKVALTEADDYLKMFGDKGRLKLIKKAKRNFKKSLKPKIPKYELVEVADPDEDIDIDICDSLCCMGGGQSNCDLAYSLISNGESCDSGKFHYKLVEVKPSVAAEPKRWEDSLSKGVECLVSDDSYEDAANFGRKVMVRGLMPNSNFPYLADDEYAYSYAVPVDKSLRNKGEGRS